MLSSEQCKETLDAGLLTYQDVLTLDCKSNTLTFPHQQKHLILNEMQKRLLVCLIKGLTCKQKIINIVWYENHRRINDNNYHQLVFQFRALLKQHQLPAKLIITVPYYGLKLNEPLLETFKSNTGTPAYNLHKTRAKQAPAHSSLISRLLALGRSFFTLCLLILV
ncbi:winged helix-turn-helix domain-containing protein [Enterobacter cloacae]|uniref:winged helix-turn-helix domain-containing protein n=1 Tax=Enterobacter cloacae TaxID=550 RepID=UPI00101B150B|nr:hypothetical protein [Enterobacter cloacae]QBC03368.1 hypothetical protein EWI30_15310 [Enterobacter cloacae]